MNQTEERMPCYTMKIRGGCETYIKADGSKGTAGKGVLIQTEKSATLAVAQDQYLFEPVNHWNRRKETK